MNNNQANFTQVITIPKEEADFYQKNVLDITDGHYKDAGRDEVICTYSTEFNTPHGDFGVDIKVCNGDTPYIDPILFNIQKSNDPDTSDVWDEMFPIDVTDTLVDKYEFEFDAKVKNGENDKHIAIKLTVIVKTNDK